MSEPVQQRNKKVCLLGDFAVGKTSLVRRAVEGRFDDKYLSTIGVKVDRRVQQVMGPEGPVVLSVMLWDLAGGPDLAPVAPSYLRGASGALIVCDLTRPESLAGTGVYAERFLAANPGAPWILVANKADLITARQLSDGELAEAAAVHGVPLLLTSAKSGDQVEELFQQLGLLLIQPEWESGDD
jgi:small GTP-binding protein